MTDAPTAPPRDTLVQQFIHFLQNYGVLGLAIAFVIGQALTQLVQVVVRGLVMPLLTPVLPGERLNAMVADLGPFKGILYGEIIAASINFLVIASFVFVVAKYLLRQTQVKKL